ncbi:hsp90 co-chaperone Cdc37 [Vermiconidia calcicola]|uniref:Hsp90 co-chaperone Cdc37 n=1 Tax=Vermiconidia calcicola TaxID=1690605 RepID=A0ACC3NF33_9PEZI|nr:hsp90 co-chaperone Cdc37 [Vermiconidia calcicola]
MPVDYSKWDNLELSDDSDIEVHPNVDKRSFIRAKQNQIHQQRFDRKHRISTLKYERVVNDGLLVRIDALLKSLEEHKKEVEGKKEASDVDEVVFDALIEVSSDGSLGADYPPSPPENVHMKEEQPSYGKMMGALVDQVKTEVDKSKSPEGKARYEAYIKEVRGHKSKVQGLQKDLNTEMTKLEKEEGTKITSDSIHTGFDSSYVAKPTSSTGATAAAKKTTKASGPELLNPSHAPADPGSQTAGSEADIEDGGLDVVPGEEEEDDEDIEASPLAKQFGKIRHPEIMIEKETDGLLAEAFTVQSNAKTQQHGDYARQCVHQALLLQYCRSLGRDGIGLFFKRIQTPNHQARKMFMDDVNSTYARIRTRTAELAKERDNEGEKEQIQLHAVNPDTTINIQTPPPMDQCETDDERASRKIFETFPPGLRSALESGSLDKVNVVLGKMSVDEAEQVVEQLSNGGMLSMEEGVIDATTEEGKKQIDEIERTKQMPGRPRLEEIEETEDLGMD